jgi:hypothetical protein
MSYDGSAAAALRIKQDELTFYLKAEQAFAAGAQSYKIKDRELTRMDPDKLHSIINQLMGEIAMLRRGRSRGIIYDSSRRTASTRCF